MPSTDKYSADIAEIGASEGSGSLQVLLSLRAEGDQVLDVIVREYEEYIDTPNEEAELSTDQISAL